MKIICLGTNGWYDTEAGNTICTLIESQRYHIILDAGDGIHKLNRFIKDTKPIYLFLSHFHLDHISGFHILPKFKFPQGIKVCGQKGIKKMIGNILRPPYSIDLKRFPYPLEFIEIGKEKDFGFMVQALNLLHSTASLGYRINIDNKIISYCLDTGFCKNAISLSKNVNLMITECSLKTGKYDKRWPHLTPRTAAIIAKKAKADRLLLTHFNPNIFQSISQRRLALKETKIIFKNSILATDDLEISL